MQSIPITHPTAFNLEWTGVFCGFGLALVLYGLYVNLFILAVYTLYRLKTAGKNVLLVACFTMFILGTTQTILHLCTTAIYIRVLQALVKSGANLGPAAFPASLTDGFVPLGLAEDIIFAINKSVNWLSTLYRCYKIWGPQKKAIILLPATLILSTAVIIFVNVATVDLPYRFGNRISFAMCTATNLVLVGLTEVNKRVVYGGSGVKHFMLAHPEKFTTCQLSSLIFSGSEDPSINMWYQIIFSASTQIVNIIPTLIVVRVGLGHNVQDSIPNQLPLKQSRQVQAEPSSSSLSVVNIAPSEM
ncbi:hypothetical protein GGX14DRAFT_586883 [Mycena pura]|uniref:Uncharacterized protein n=1 Tax=Mycena pura TaxID=153505 RepID=A0AAD6UX98_9AGAR|nr:hypothetical protein GGX14DRAFT_586883 [Mycena pura]